MAVPDIALLTLCAQLVVRAALLVVEVCLLASLVQVLLCGGVDGKRLVGFFLAASAGILYDFAFTIRVLNARYHYSSPPSPGFVTGGSLGMVAFVAIGYAVLLVGKNPGTELPDDLDGWVLQCVANWSFWAYYVLPLTMGSVHLIVSICGCLSCVFVPRTGPRNTTDRGRDRRVAGGIIPASDV